MAPLRIGVMMEAVQYSDIAGLDIFGSISTLKAQEALDAGLPISDISSYYDITFDYISSSLSPAPLTPTIQFLPTTTYDTCPRDYDIVFIGGPLPNHHPAAADKFLKETADKAGLFMTTCTGSMWLASSGVLDGKRATTNAEMLEAAKQMYPAVKWEKKRWVVDGKFWTAGGAYVGVDMVAKYALDNFENGVVKQALALLALTPKLTADY